MPLYEYACEAGHHFDKLVPSSLPEEQKETTECKECGQPAHRTISTGTSFILKGKWFKQGY
jgi:putative FmdB family regulatory protein